MRAIDECRARGCGGWLAGMGTDVVDGSEARCSVCDRRHVVVAFEDDTFRVVPDRAPRKRAPRVRTYEVHEIGCLVRELAALRVEVARLTEERDAAKTDTINVVSEYVSWRDEFDTLSGLMSRWVDHQPSCDTTWSNALPCSCGLAELRQHRGER